MANNSLGLGARISGLFASHFFGFGLFLPFFPVVLEHRGLTAGEIGFVLGAGTIARISASPVMTNLSDRSGRRRLSIFAYSLLSSAALGVLLAGSGLINAFIAIVLMMIFWAPIVPLSDAYALDVVRKTGIDYGRMRLWGSVAFVVANIVGGALTGSETTWILIVGVMLSGAMTGIAAISLPAGSARPDAATKPESGPPTPFRTAWFWLALALFGLFQASHGAFYVFGTLYWQRLGITDVVIGLLWSLGVVSEIVLFWVARPLSKRYDPIMFLVVAGIASAVRWGMFTHLESVPALAAMQLLHGLSFGAAHLGSVAFLAKVVPSRWSGTGQGLLSTSIGLQMALSLWICGELYEVSPTLPFEAMAVVSVGGVVLMLAVTPILRRHMKAADRLPG